MKRAVLDTHALVWHLTSPKRLGAGARKALRDADSGRTEILIPAIVIVELTLLQRAGRKTVGAAEVHAVLAAQPAFRVAPLDLAQAIEFSLLSNIGDPFDRMIVAAARVLDAPLVTADDAIHTAALVPVIWD